MSEYNETPDVKPCESVAYQTSSVCVPVTVTPFAKTGETKTKCCGTTIVTTGKNTCSGTKNGECVFTISQDICIEIPVQFGAVAKVGDTYVDCLETASYDDCDCNG